MLTLYKRRHDNDCLENLAKRRVISSPDADKLSTIEKKYLLSHFDCRCAFWARGTNDYGKSFLPMSLKVYTKGAADLELKKLNQPLAVAAESRVTIEAARERWAASLRVAEKHPHTIYQYERTVKDLETYCTGKKITALADVTDEHVNGLRQIWVGDKIKRNTHRNRLGFLATFFKYCVDKKLALQNVAAMTPPVRRARQGETDRDEATMPLDLDGTETNYRKLLAAVPEYFAGEIGQTKKGKRKTDFKRARRVVKSVLGSRPDHFIALLELMYNTGLRISDAIHFKVGKLIWKETCAVYQTIQIKTNEPVTCYLPLWLAQKIAALEPISGEYVFFDGRPDWKNYISNNVWMYLKFIGNAVGLPGVHPHRFRDSFAVSCLNRGLRLEDVQKLLGHTNIRTTERYYAPFVKSRREYLEGALLDSWGPVEKSKVVTIARKRRAG